MHIPGISFLTDKETIPEMLLLIGPVGAGKTMYCKQFFEDGMLDRDYCIYVSSSLTNKQFRTPFSSIENQNLIQNSKFINPYLYDCALSKQAPDSSISSHSPTVSDDKTSSFRLSGPKMSQGISKLSLTLAEIDGILALMTMIITRIILQLPIEAFA